MRNAMFMMLFCFMASSVISSGSNVSLKRLVSHNYTTVAEDDKQQKKESATKIIYTCSMHPEVIQDKSGKCPKCGMKLDQKEIAKEVYACPMHMEITQDKPGKCSKCKMNLVKKEPAKKEDIKKK